MTPPTHNWRLRHAPSYTQLGKDEPNIVFFAEIVTDITRLVYPSNVLLKLLFQSRKKGGHVYFVLRVSILLLGLS
jgi:hypothetical protein